MTPRTPDSDDATRMLGAARALVEHGTLLTSPPSNSGIGQSLVMTPLYLIGGVPGGMQSNAVAFAVLTGFTVALARSFGARQAATASVCVLLGTPLLPYVGTGFPELWVAAGVAALLVALRCRSAVGAAIATGACVLFRIDSVVLILPVATVTVASWRSRSSMVRFLGVLTPFALVVAWWNWARFGSVLVGGYPGEKFSHNFLIGVAGLMVSPGRGLLPYTPLVFLALFGIRAAWRADRAMSIAIISLFVARVLFYASWWSWPGGISWGPRFLVPALPGLVVPMIYTLRRLQGEKILGPAAGLVVAGSIAIQLIAVVVPYRLARAAMEFPAVAPASRADELAHHNGRAYQEAVDRHLFARDSWSVRDQFNRARHPEDVNQSDFRARIARARTGAMVGLVLAGGSALIRMSRGARPPATEISHGRSRQ